MMGICQQDKNNGGKVKINEYAFVIKFSERIRIKVSQNSFASKSV